MQKRTLQQILTEYVVYAHINKINNMIYVGITSRKPEDRWGSNGMKYRGSSRFYNAVQKYTWEGFWHEIIASNLTEQEAKNLEILLISKIPREESYNITAGGDGSTGYIASEETKKKLSISRRLRKMNPHSEETKRKMSKAAEGKPKSEEHRKKLSEVNKGKILSKEHRKKISEGNKGKVMSLESKRKMSEAAKGRGHSEEAKRKMSESHKGKILSEETKRKMSIAQKGRYANV